MDKDPSNIYVELTDTTALHVEQPVISPEPTPEDVPENIKLSPLNLDKIFWKAVVVVGVGAVGLHTLNSVYQAGREDERKFHSSAPVEHAEPMDPVCVKAPEHLNILNPVEAAKAVNGIDFAMTEERLEVLAGRINDAPDIKTLGTIMNDVFGEYKATVAFGALPAKGSVDTGTAPARYTQDVSKINLQAAKVSSEHILSFIQTLPRQIMELYQGYNIYLTTGITINGQPDSMHLELPTTGNMDFILGIGDKDPTTRDMQMATTWLLYDHMCKNVPFKDDKDFVNLNPPGFVYTNDADIREKMFDMNAMPRVMGITGPDADELYTIQAVLFEQGVSDCVSYDKNYTSRNFDANSGACKKSQLIAGRLEADFPGTINLLALNTYAIGQKPQDGARNILNDRALYVENQGTVHVN